MNINKLNPKPRLVFDPAARNMGISLNSQLLTGPDAVPQLIDLEKAALESLAIFKKCFTALEFEQMSDVFIRNFIYNSSHLTNQIPCERVSTQPVLKISEGTSNFDKILGQYWEKEKDVFKFILNDLTIPGHSVSKREMLAKTMKIYDPMGLLTNYTIEPKILIQEVWKLKIDWDQNIPPDLNKKWQNW
uniref:Uncharacterized protein n=1 Tax=Anopheles quadriannulatus TaxID=34691 RepID=A0A182XQ04_ANOQN